MSKKISPIINAIDLLEISQFENLVIVDVRTGNFAKANYLEKHLKGALFVDLNTQLADIKDDFAVGGRHPLPSLDVFSKTLLELGISKDSHVIIYDDKKEMEVVYKGLIPSLFKEGQNVITYGKFNKDEGQFKAKELLAKHDENYIPKNYKNAKTNLK